MEKPNIKETMARFTALYERMRSGAMDPDMLWRAVIYGVLLGIMIVAVFAYTTYTWAINSELPPSAPHATSTALSLAELEGVISAYGTISSTHDELMHAAPSAPSFDRGAGIEVDLDAIASSTPTTATSTPRSPSSII